MKDTSRLMFIEDSEPLSNARVQVADDPDQIWYTDEEGRLEVELEEHVELLVEHSSTGLQISQRIDTTLARNSLMIVNIAPVLHNMTNPGTPVTPGLARVTNGESFLQEQLLRMGSRYRFGRVLGRGGMGIVFQAYDSILDRPVAMKMLSEELRDNPEAQRIFLTEARSLAGLSHPNLVAIHDVTEIDGCAVMVFEFVEGREIEEIYQERGQLDQACVLDIARQLAGGLAYLHEAGLIHRDVKPSNAMLDADGVVKIIDFGLARTLRDINIKGTQVRGTPAYMSPEQILGKELTPATDMYQFGITLYELLTGQLPFINQDLGYAHVHLEPDPVETHLPSIHPDLAGLIRACLKKDPTQRLVNAQEAVALLEHILWTGDDAMPRVDTMMTTSQGFASEEPAFSPAPLAPPTGTRHKKLALLVMLLFLGAGVLIGAGVWTALSLNTTSHNATGVAITSIQEPQVAPETPSVTPPKPITPKPEPVVVEPASTPTPTPAPTPPEPPAAQKATRKPAPSPPKPRRTVRKAPKKEADAPKKVAAPPPEKPGTEAPVTAPPVTAPPVTAPPVLAKPIKTLPAPVPSPPKAKVNAATTQPAPKAAVKKVTAPKKKIKVLRKTKKKYIPRSF